MTKRTYSPEFRLQALLETLQSEGTDVEVVRAYDIHPVTLSNWKKNLKEQNGRITKLERMVGEKEFEIDLLKNFLARKAIRGI